MYTYTRRPFSWSSLRGLGEGGTSANTSRHSCLSSPLGNATRPRHAAPPLLLPLTPTLLPRPRPPKNYQNANGPKQQQYRQVFDDYVSVMDKSSTLLTRLPTPVFWYGLVTGQEFSITPSDPADLLLKSDGVTDVKIRLERVGPAKKGGMRTVSFKVGGSVQNVEVKDSVAGNDFDGPMAAAGNALEVCVCVCVLLVSHLLVSVFAAAAACACACACFAAVGDGQQQCVARVLVGCWRG